MNKAYRQVYKDGIGWVAIAENGSCVSSSKGSGTVSSKTKVEVLKNFFDLRNSVVLNNSFLLKGLFAATLFCGGFVTQGFAEVTQKEILDIQNNGTTVYTDNDGNRMEKVINEEGEVIFADGSILNKADSDGIIHIDGKDYVVPTGTLNKPDTDEFGDKAKLFRVKKDETTGEWRGLTFKELKEEDSKLTMGLITTKNSKFQTVIYDKDKKKWFVHNQASEAQLYQAKKKNGEVAYYAWTSIQKDINGVPLKTVDGYYMPLANATAEANEIKNLGYDIVQVASKNKAERLSLVGIDGKTVKPIKYTQADETNGKIPDGRKVGDNKNGTIRLGNVAKAELDDEAVNLGQLNEKLENSKTHYVSIKSSTIKDNYYNDGAKSENAIAIGPNAQAKSQNVVSIGESAGKTSLRNGNGSIFIGRNAGKDSDVLDPQSVENWGAVYIGQDAGRGSKGDGNLYLGSDAGFKHQGSQNIFLGDGARNLKDQQGSGENEITKGNRNIAIGNQYVHNPAKVYGEDDALNDTITIGTATRASANGAIAIGSAYNYSYDEQSKLTYYTATSANGVRSIALGSGILVNSENGVAIGFGSGISDEKVTDAVALGSYSKASREALDDTTKKDVYLGDNEAVAKTVVNTKGAISVGSTIEGLDAKGNKVNPFTRQITNLAAGTKDTDAVNVAQLKAKADLDAKNLSNKTGNTANETYADVWKTALGIKDLNADKLFTAKADKSADGAKIGANGELKFFGDENVIASSDTNGIKYTLNKALTNINSITTENNGDLTIKAGNETYTFDNGDNKNAGTNVVTNDKLTTKVTKAVGASKFAIKGDNNTEGKVKLSEGLSVVGATDSGITTKAEDGKFTLSLNADKVKEIAGVDGLDDKLAAKANLNASNLTKDSDKNAWKTALGIKDLNTNQLFTAKADKATNGATIGANGELKFFGDDNVIASSDTNGIKYSLNKNLTNINSITTENNGDLVINAGTKKYTFGDTNLVDTSVITNSDIANIFKGEKGISIDKKGNQYTISYTGTGGGTGTGGISKDEVKEIIENYIGSNNIGSSIGSTDNIVTHNVSKQETTNNKNIIAAINKINEQGIGFVHVNGGKLTPVNGISANDSQANGGNSIAIGPKSQANGDNSIAIGPKSKTNANAKNAIAIGTESQANGENSIAIGVRNVVTGKNSGAFGDPNTVRGNNSYAAGNDNTVNSNDTFVLGNNVTVNADMQGAVVLGNHSTADKIATQESRATVNGITYDGFIGQAASKGMILSVGAKGAERQIKNVAAGQISENSTDAVNGSQLHATNKIIGNVANSVANVIGGNAKVNEDGKISASNIGRTGQPTINDAIASINNKINSGGNSSYIAIDTPTNGGGLPSVGSGSNSIAIGAGSSDDKRKNVVSVGNATKGLNRTITNVAPGRYGTDAVNMNQLYGVAGGLSKQINDVKKKSSAGIAGAVALGMLPQSNIPGDALVSIGTGYHDSESAVALGISKTSDNARWIFKGGVSYDSQDEVTAGASVGFHF